MSSAEEEIAMPAPVASGSNVLDKEALIRSVVSAVMEGQANTVTTIAKEVVDNLLSDNKAEVDEKIESGIRQREKLQVDFKNEGNWDQYRHQKEILDHFEDLERAVAKKDEAKIASSINAGKKLVKKRMKLIRLAEREDWMTVKEYVSDDLASDSDDDKQIAKAIKAAASKKEKMQKAKLKKPEARRGVLVADSADIRVFREGREQ